MGLFRTKPLPSPAERLRSLKYTPVKSREIIESRLDSGEATIDYPVVMRPWLAGLARRLGAAPGPVRRKKLQLDLLGTSVWDMLDGKRSVHGIVEDFAATHRLHRREAEVAVTQFIRELGRRGLIGLR